MNMTMMSNEHDQGQDNEDLHNATDGEGVHEGQKALDQLRTTPELFLSLPPLPPSFGQNPKGQQIFL